MAKRFKHRISRVINTTFQSCRSKDLSILPHEINPVPSFFRFNPLLPPDDDNFPSAALINQPPPSTTHRHRDDDDDNYNQHLHRSSFKRNVYTSAAFISRRGSCGFSSTKHEYDPHHHHHRRRRHHRDDATSSSSFEEFKWRKEDKWHVVAKIYDQNRTRHPPMPPPPPALKKLRIGSINNNKKKKKISSSSSRFHVSTSSPETSVLFSSEEVGDQYDDELELQDSRSFYSRRDTRHHRKRRTTSSSSASKKKKKKKKNRRRSRTINSSEAGAGDGAVVAASSDDHQHSSPARLSVFKKLIPCTVDGKVKDSFAIVKKSEDPYGDFKKSMMEMILEKQMFEEKDLEQLLQCFLSLNSRNYHRLIVEAFADIWESMFFSGSITTNSTSARNSIHHHR